jgi:type IV pilus secretin PilQ/predicted competence protein
MAAEPPAASMVSGGGQDAMSMEQRLKQIISLEYKDADVGSVLRSLSVTYKLNMVTAPDIKGKVTINLQDIPLEKALESILAVNGLVFQKRDGVLYVGAGDPQLVEISTEVVGLKYLTADQAMNLSKKILSAKGDIKVNETANDLIVTDYAINVQKIREFLEKVDVAPKQVLIEAKIVDITSSDLQALGVTYNANYAPGKGLFTRGTQFAEEADATVTMAEESSSLAGSQIAINALTLKNFSLTATIDALVRDGKASLLASPSIAVISGQEARIVIGERFPFKERTQTTSGTTETTKFVDIGTTLKVNPQINDDGYITLTLHPEVSSLLSSLDAGPRITTREADTTVRIKEGETLVIGGLIRQIDNSSADRIPILGDIPIIKHLFSRRESESQQTELAVFITCRILFSQEEKTRLGRRFDERENPKALIDETGSLNLVERLFLKADQLDLNKGVESVRKDEPFRKSQALSHFELIYKQFPESQQAAEAQFRAGRIYWEYYHDDKKAKEVLAGVISSYPRSPFAEQAGKLYERIDQTLMAVWNGPLESS